MKPLPTAPLTPLDDQIMRGIRTRWRYPLNHWYQFYDRKDAELMHHCTYCRDLPRLERWRGFAVAHVIQRGDCERFAWKV